MNLILATFLWWGLTANKLMKQINDTHLKIASMCIAHQLGETGCYDAINRVTDLKFKVAISKDNKRMKIIQAELQEIIDYYEVK